MSVILDKRFRMNISYLADVDKSTHETLIAESLNGLLSLVSSCVFHNPNQYQQMFLDDFTSKLTRIPTHSMDQVQSVNPMSNRKKTKKKDQQNQPHHTMAPTFDIPLGSSKTSAKRTSPAISNSQPRIPSTNLHSSTYPVA